MRITCHIIRLHVKGIVHKAFRAGNIGLAMTKQLNETRKYVVLGTSYEDALERVRSRVMPELETKYEALVTEWGHDGDRGDVVELAKVDVETHPGTNIPKDDDLCYCSDRECQRTHPGQRLKKS